jgi:putative transposase
MNLKASITTLSSRTGMTPQNYHKGHKVRKKKQADGKWIKQMVLFERIKQPRLGGKKSYIVLKPAMRKAGINIGRDMFLQYYKTEGLTLEPLRRNPGTTNSRHSLPVFPNQFKDMELTAPNQAWVSDITYISTDQGFLYLSLITDAWSRKIVGFHGDETLETQGCLKALNKALSGLKGNQKPVHHSDRGCQYCSNMYVEKLRRNGIGISMTEKNHCAENAMAERMNGILKQEYGLGSQFRTKAQALKSINQAVHLYNTRRPHMALKYKTPEEVHRRAA